MTRDNVMSTPIFDELLREMTQRAESRPPAAPTHEPPTVPTPDPTRARARRRHRAE